MSKTKSKKLPAKIEEKAKTLSALEKEVTGAEKELLTKHRDRVNARYAAPKLKVENKPGKATNISVEGESQDKRIVATVALMDAFGTTSIEFQSYMMRELVDAACKGSKIVPYEEADLNGVIGAMHGINPRDEVEGMLANQMIATHFAAMRVMRQLKNSETVPQQDSNGNLAIKLLRTYTAQVEALQRYRGKGEQKMTVEHVHVHPGGQAIVGNVTRTDTAAVPGDNNN